ncbi:YIP1 family protein [Paenibacillus sp. J5C_2022]|uniref:YIP1 family protein n=1 Tax=Paenibacillus sp. J5C2022 TaxID=2977129 RepID=UPI0021D0E95F|nr:YIP1 family protein [Paenibacillus sp. J5C2022]MCU6711141.1 YIP1 family protein [Paenibacillus sp. J5C2022]
MAIIFVLLAISLPAVSVSAAPYYGYSYSSYGEAVHAPLPYLPERIVYGDDIGAGGFLNPEDVFAAPDGSIYIADTGNNRVVVTDASWSGSRVIDSFVKNGTTEQFKEPKGVFVDDNNVIYIADSGNGRVVMLNEQGEYMRIVEAPQSDVVRDDFKFVPVKLTADAAGRLFVVSQGVYDGIVEYDAAGRFTGFTGKNMVRFDAADLFWKQLATEAQRKQMNLYIPVEFNNVDIDEEGFVYATATENNISTQMVKRLNPSGIDVLDLKGTSNIQGDLRVTRGGSFRGSSAFISVAVYGNGIYAALDAKRGRIFTYDADGNLLFQFGQVGDKAGNFRAPAEVEWVDDGIIVADRTLHRLSVFRPTRYGKLLLDASSAYYNGHEEEASRLWHEVSQLNRNLELAHVGIGKAKFESGEYEAAMASFKRGEHRPYYSKAFGASRKDWLWDNFSYLFIGLLLAAAALFTLRKRLPAIVSENGGPMRLALRTSIKPFSMFWELKYEQKGQLWVAWSIVIGVAVLSMLRKFYSGFLVTGYYIPEMSSVSEMALVIVPFIVWCIASWSLTTLMDGEGKFREIVIASGYAMLPLLLVYIPQLFFSWIMTTEEIAFFLLFDSIALLWFIGLLFVGTMTVHQFTPLKTVITMLLTVVVIAIIIFLALLFFSIVQQLMVFVSTVYQELSLR